MAFRDGETVGSIDFAQSPRDESLIVPLITGQAARARVRKNRGEREGEMQGFTAQGSSLEVQDISLPDGRLSNVSFSLRRGEVLGLGGLQGQGQEEILHDPRRLPPRLHGPHPR